jgi:hypothetical protein
MIGRKAGVGRFLLFRFSMSAALGLASCLGPTAPGDRDAEGLADRGDLAVSLATTTLFEAEKAKLSGAVIASEKTGFSGAGYADYQNANNDYVQWTVSIGSAGDYSVAIRYANGGTTNRPLTVTVTGATTIAAVKWDFPSTGSWTTWKTITKPLSLKAGSNVIKAVAAGSSGGNVDYLSITPSGSTTPPPPPPPSGKKHVVGYLPDWDGDYATWAGKLNWGSLTHVNLAFGNPNSNGVTTLGQSASSLNTLVSTAHGKGVKVLVSIGGASGLGDVSKWLGSSRSTYVSNLANFVSTYKLDGVDVDLEGADVNSNYGAFVSDLINKLRPNGKLVTAAVAPWFSDNISSSTLQSYDFINVMAYDECGEWTSACEQSTYSAAQNMLNYYAGRGVSKAKMVLGLPFYGWCWGSGCGESEWSYAKIISKFSTANQKDWYTASGITLSYNGRPTVQKKAALARSYGGVMAWELPSDATGSASLLSLAASTLWAP